MSIDELEAAALKLEPKARARLAERLLDSLEHLSPDENARLWAEEAQRRARPLTLVRSPAVRLTRCFERPERGPSGSYGARHVQRFRRA